MPKAMLAVAVTLPLFLGTSLPSLAQALAQEAWVLRANTVEVSDQAESADFQLIKADARSGELRVVRRMRRSSRCQSAVRWSFDRELRVVRVGDRIRVEFESKAVAGGKSCRKHGPYLNLISGNGESTDSRSPFKVIDARSSEAVLEVVGAAAPRGSFLLRVSVGEATADIEWRFAAVRQFEVPEEEQGTLITFFEPGPAGSRVISLPPSDTPEVETITLETEFQYAVKFVCTFFGSLPSLQSVGGTYRTVVNVRNPTEGEIRFATQVSLALSITETSAAEHCKDP